MFRRARFQALADWLLTTDPHQRIRMFMAGVACLLLLCCVLVVNLMAAAGMARPDWVCWWSLFSVSGILGILLMIRRGWVRHWRDPSLTQLQIRYSLVSTAAAYVVAGQGRGIVPVILAIVLLFSIFGLTPRQMVHNMLYTLVLFAIAFATVNQINGPWRAPALEAAYATMIVLILLTTTFMAMRLQKIRAQLKQQKRELTLALAQIRHLATHDDLTSLPNRRHMMALLEAEHLRSQRDARPWMVALLDIDFFKQVNDTHGHGTGDLVLQTFAATVGQALRTTDTLARWGGEEFLLLLPDTGPDAAATLLDRVRQTVQDSAVQAKGQAVRVTVSIGVAAHTASTTLAQLLDQADQALYQAKQKGRNCVVQAQPV